MSLAVGTSVKAGFMVALCAQELATIGQEFEMQADAGAAKLARVPVFPLSPCWSPSLPR